MDVSETKFGNALHLKGFFYLHGKSVLEFKGPIKKGLRMVIWNTELRATSCSFVKNIDINIGDTAIVEIVISIPASIVNKIRIGEKYSIGNPGTEIGIFELKEIVGEWFGKAP